jgi:hypothetical protein
MKKVEGQQKAQRNWGNRKKQQTVPTLVLGSPARGEEAKDTIPSKPDDPDNRLEILAAR